MSRLPFYDHILLSLEETEEAILQGKIKKYFKTKNAPYWEEKENGILQVQSPSISKNRKRNDLTPTK